MSEIPNMANESVKITFQSWMDLNELSIKKDFAQAAMAAVLSNTVGPKYVVPEITILSCDYADALFEELKRRTKA